MSADASSAQSESRIPTTSASLTALREHGEPMTLRELTRATAKAMGWSLMYLDVAGVMARHLSEGQVSRTPARDYRDDVWTAL